MVDLFIYLFIVCNKTIDIGFVVDFSSTTSTNRKEELIKEFVITTGLSIDIHASGSHFAYIPYSTWPGDYSDYQWFNNTRIANLPYYNKTALLAHLNDVVKRDPDTAFDRGM